MAEATAPAMIGTLLRVTLVLSCLFSDSRASSSQERSLYQRTHTAGALAFAPIFSKAQRAAGLAVEATNHFDWATRQPHRARMVGTGERPATPQSSAAQGGDDGDAAVKKERMSLAPILDVESSQAPVLRHGEAFTSARESRFFEQHQVMESKAETLLAKAFADCEAITSEYAKTFHFGTQFMGPEQAKCIQAIYVWCRRTDNIVDSPLATRRPPDKLRDDLVKWEERTERLFEGQAMDYLDLPMVDTIRKYPDLDITPFRDMIKGMVMDLEQDRYATFEELYLYCYRVAGTVGLMSLPIMGTAKDSSYQEALEPALALGVALQLTNILRDVGEDTLRGRIYLPLEDLKRFNVPEENILNGVMDDNYIDLLKYEISLARKYYELARTGIPMLHPTARLPVQLSCDLYSQILDKIEMNNYDNFRKRAFVPKSQKFQTLFSSWLKLRNMPLTR